MVHVVCVGLDNEFFNELSHVVGIECWKIIFMGNVVDILQ